MMTPYYLIPEERMGIRAETAGKAREIFLSHPSVKNRDDFRIIKIEEY
jgi:hypothetical protein